ncbi:hypothetical protein [Amycolatopsis sp. NPDC049868]|uniref:hypothetical protein n=1 Tax=Amycolatopsis sp. NPDC049868 TaxID=3363934 RepID=UPI00378CF2CE
MQPHQCVPLILCEAAGEALQMLPMLRQLGFEGTVAILTDECDLPYECPPLTKEYLSGDKRDLARTLIRPPEFWPERAIDVIRQIRVSRVDPVRKLVMTTGGRAVEYGSLIWAAGGRARRLSCLGAEASNLFCVRGRGDADAVVAR